MRIFVAVDADIDPAKFLKLIDLESGWDKNIFRRLKERRSGYCNSGGEHSIVSPRSMDLWELTRTLTRKFFWRAGCLMMVFGITGRTQQQPQGLTNDPV